MTPRYISGPDGIQVTLPSGKMSIPSRQAFVAPGAANFTAVKEALERGADAQEVAELIDEKTFMMKICPGLEDLGDGTMSFAGHIMPAAIAAKIKTMLSAGSDPRFLVRFWERLAKNPSHRSVTQLWGFLQHTGITLTKSGCILAYKSVRKDFLDHHSGKWKNTPGKVLEMPRNQISDDPSCPCHEGFHAGALQYASTFGGSDNSLIIIVKIDPEDVVCIPYDHSCQKMRTCRYHVVGLYSGSRMDDKEVFDDEDLPEIEVTVVSSLDEEISSQLAPGIARRKKSDDEVLAMTMDELREYARTELLIIGANKIRGGKFALLEVILSVPQPG